MRRAAPGRAAAIGLMIVAPLLWSIAGVLTRQLEAARSFEVVFWRSLFAALFVAGALLVLHGRGATGVVASSGRAGLVSGAMWAVMFTAFMIALTMTTTANTLVGSSLAPFLSVLLAWIVLRDPVRRGTWFAIAAAGVGVAIMFGGGIAADEPRHLYGTLVALLVPFAVAINLVVLRRSSARVDLVPAVLLGAIVSAAVALPLALPFAATARDLAILATLGVFQLGLPCMLLVAASRTLGPGELVLLGQIEIVAGPLWAWLGAGEVPATATVVGGAIVLAALVLNQLASMVSERTARPGASLRASRPIA